MKKIKNFFVPDFIEIQRSNFQNFLKYGLINEIKSKSQIFTKETNLTLVLYPEYYKITPAEVDEKLAITTGISYSGKLYLPAQLINKKTGISHFQWILLGTLPLMNKRGHFVLNGSPRVIINQMIRSPGIYFVQSLDRKGDKTVYADLISQKGTWLRFEIDNEKIPYLRMKRTPKIPIFLLLQAMGMNISNITQRLEKKDFFHDAIMKGYELTKFHELEGNSNKKVFFKNKFDSLENLALISLYGITHSKRDLLDITPEMGRKFIFRKFQNPKTYDLGILGRRNLNQKFNLSISLDTRVVTAEDIFKIIDFLAKVFEGNKLLDDIDDLKNRRVRSSSELIQNQFSIGLTRFEKIIIDRLKRPNIYSSLSYLITTKPMNSALREFFGSSQLSQFLDQTNPLAEITHKRRFTSLGPSGVSRETAGMVIRSIHPTHYGRICPIETPEGQNAGLVNSPTSYANINSNGFIETPFVKVYKGQIQEKIYYMTADQEEIFFTAPADIDKDFLNFLPRNSIPVRFNKNFVNFNSNKINFFSLSSLQMISVATSLIPFLEHDDANRALMGSNMQRQAVPLMKTERPFVGTGYEGRVVSDSGHTINAKHSGYVLFVSSEKIKVLSLVGSKFQKPLRISTETKEDLNNQNQISLKPIISRGKKLDYFNSSKKLIAKKNNQNIKKFNYFWTKNTLIFSLLVSTGTNRSPEKKRKSLKKKEIYVNITKCEKKNKRKFIKYLFSSQIRYSVLKNQNLLFGFNLNSTTKKVFNNSFCAKENDNLKEFAQNFNQNQSVTTMNTPNYLHGFNLGDNYKLKIITYKLQNLARTNQDTCVKEKPLVLEGQWVETGDVLADGAASFGGELALGKNLLLGYLPWEGYNFEDAIVISERLVQEDVFTSLHVEKYEIEVKDTRFGSEKITKDIPEISIKSKTLLDNQGIVKLGSWVTEGDILVGKITPINRKPLSPHERLLYDIVGKDVRNIKDSSLRIPKGVSGRIVTVRIFDHEGKCFEKVFEEKSSSFARQTNDGNLLISKRKKPLLVQTNEEKVLTGKEPISFLPEKEKLNNEFIRIKKNFHALKKQNNLDFNSFTQGENRVSVLARESQGHGEKNKKIINTPEKRKSINFKELLVSDSKVTESNIVLKQKNEKKNN